jgi:hypothetical protein
MATFRKWWVGALVACVMIGGSAAVVRAQSCGDPNGDGVNVIDAANVLRAAVSLPSSCQAAPALCDVDGTGTITVIDSANVLRRAVGLPGANACTIANQQVSDVLTQLEPLLTLGIATIPGQTAQAATTLPCDSGSIEIFDTFADFNDCLFLSIVFNGSITLDGDMVGFDLSLQDIISGESLTAGGTLQATDLPNDVPDFGPFLNGTLNIDSSDLGRVAIGFVGVSLTLAPSGTPIFGAIVFALADIPGIDEIRQLLNGDDLVRVIVLNDGVITDQFLFDPLTDALTVAPLATCLSCAGPQGPFCGPGEQPVCDADCFCLRTSSGECFCHQNSPCAALSPCSTDFGCPSGFRCTSSCCAGGALLCHPPCGTFVGTAAGSPEIGQTTSGRPR